jgi:hypothetical protein
MSKARTSEWWLGYLAGAIGWFLNTHDEEHLRNEYRRFLRSPLATPAVREKLPEIGRRRRG